MKCICMSPLNGVYRLLTANKTLCMGGIHTGVEYGPDLTARAAAYDLEDANTASPATMGTVTDKIEEQVHDAQHSAVEVLRSTGDTLVHNIEPVAKELPEDVKSAAAMTSEKVGVAQKNAVGVLRSTGDAIAHRAAEVTDTAKNALGFGSGGSK